MKDWGGKAKPLRPDNWDKLLEVDPPLKYLLGDSS